MNRFFISFCRYSSSLSRVGTKAVRVSALLLGGLLFLACEADYSQATRFYRGQAIPMGSGSLSVAYVEEQYSVSITISGLEKRSNMGEAAMINLLSAKTTQTEMSLRDKMSVETLSQMVRGMAERT